MINYDKKFCRYKDGAALYSMSQSKFEQLAKDAKAIYKIDKLVLVNMKILDEYGSVRSSVNTVDNSSDQLVGKIDQSEKPTTLKSGKVVEKNDRSEIPTSRTLEIRPQEVGKTDPNYNNHNDTDNNYISPVQSCHITEEDDWLDHIDCSKPFKVTGYYPKKQRQDRQDEIQPDKDDYIEYLKRNIGYDGMIREDCYRFEKDKIDGIINMIADIVTTTPPDGKEWVNSRPYSHEVVKSRLMKTDRFVLEHVLDRMKENTTKIRNMRAYLLTALYNAKDEMDISVESQVNYDWKGGGMEERGAVYA